MKPSRLKRKHYLGFGGVMYIVVAGFIGTAAFNSQTNLLFWIFGLMIGGLVVSVAASAAMLTGLRVKRLLPDHGAVGEPLLVRYELTNRKRMMPCFGLIVSEEDGTASGVLEAPPHGWVLHVGPKSTVQAETIGWPHRRGLIRLRRVRITTTFPFGIVRKSVLVEQSGRVVVYPRLHRLRRELLREIRSSSPVGSRSSRRGGGGEEFFGLREYRHGDSMKTIDWKHSARIGELVSRERTQPTPPQLMVLLDLNDKGHYPYEEAERAISFAASVLCEASMEGFEVGLLISGATCPAFEPHHGRWHRTRMLHALGELDLSAEESAPEGIIDGRDRNWLVIHAGEANRDRGPADARHLSGADLESWRLHGDEADEADYEPPQAPHPPREEVTTPWT